VGQIIERTITKVGSGSLVVVLPKGWLKWHSLQPGDKVQVITNGELRVRPLKKAAGLARNDLGSNGGPT
jgi:antitoxin component of MazEF toxin-antitoxin module